MYASDINAAGSINVRAIDGGRLGVYAFNEYREITQDSRTRSSFLGIKYRDTKVNSSRRISSMLPSVIAAQGNIQALASGDVVLQGTILKGLGTDSTLHVEAGYGDKAHADAQLIFRHIKKRVEEEQHRESNSVVWQKMEGQGTTTETLALPQLTGFSAVRLIAPSISIDVANNPDGLEAEIDKLLGNPAYSYLKDIRVREGVNWNQIELELDKWEYEQEGLTPAGAALVAIAVAIASGGTGISAATTIGGKMGAAAMTALQSQAAITLVNNKGDIGKTLKDLESSDTIKQMATAALTAGLLDVVAGSLNLPVKPDGYLENMYVSTVNSIGSALVSTAVNGGSLSENLEQGLIAGLANGLHAGLAGDIKGLESSYVLHKIMHAAAGCVTAAAQRQACEAGAIGAAVGEMVAGSIKGDRTTAQLTEEEKKQILEVSKLVAGTVAAYTGHDVNTAANASDVAVTNNSLSVLDPVLFAEISKDETGQDIRDFVDALQNAQFRLDGKGQVYICISANTANCIGQPISKADATNRLLTDPVISASVTLVEYTPAGRISKVVHIVDPRGSAMPQAVMVKRNETVG